MSRIRIDWSDGARTRGLHLGPIEISITREPHVEPGLYLRVLWPGVVNLRHRISH